jgi:hypothetical protein
MDWLDAVDACRGLTADVWAGRRDRAVWEAAGLNAEDVVRARLRGVVQDVLQEPGLSQVAHGELSRVDVVHDAAVDVLARTEAVVRLQLGRRYASPQALLHGAGKLTFHLVRLLVLQGLAGRLGVWAVTPDGVPDARLAHRLVRGPAAPGWGQFRGLLRQAKVAYEAGRFAAAAALYLDVDRMVRTAAGLLRAATALGRSGDLEGARWAIRACLLEPPHRFEGAEAYAQAEALARRLDAQARPEAPPAAPRGASLFDAVLLTPPASVPEGPPPAAPSSTALTPAPSAPPPARSPTVWTHLFEPTERIPVIRADLDTGVGPPPAPQDDDIFAFVPDPAEAPQHNLRRLRLAGPARRAVAPAPRRRVQVRVEVRPLASLPGVTPGALPLREPAAWGVDAAEQPITAELGADLLARLLASERLAPSAGVSPADVPTPTGELRTDVTQDVLSREILRAERIDEPAPPPWIEALSQAIYEACEALVSPARPPRAAPLGSALALGPAAHRPLEPPPRAASEEDTEPGELPATLARLRVYALPDLPVARWSMAVPAAPVFPDPADVPRRAVGRSETPRPRRTLPAPRARPASSPVRALAEAVAPAWDARVTTGITERARPADALRGLLMDVSWPRYEETLKVRARRAGLLPADPHRGP